jgi:pilus assembly protein CpaF
VAGCVDVVVHTTTRRDGSRRISEIAALPGRVEGGVVEIAELFKFDGQVLRRSTGFPPHADRFESAGIDVFALLGGGQLDGHR